MPPRIVKLKQPATGDCQICEAYKAGMVNLDLDFDGLVCSECLPFVLELPLLCLSNRITHSTQQLTHEYKHGGR